MLETLNTSGREKIDRMFKFERNKGYTQNVIVTFQSDAMLSGEQTKKIIDALDEFIEKVKKCVEEER